MEKEIFRDFRYRAHPWHGVDIGERCPQVVRSYIEIVPSDLMKYEVDKETGILKIDRPQQFSNHCPSLYGFIPRTYCGALVGDYCREKSGRASVQYGDKDPLDICVFSEKALVRGDILVQAVPIGGFRMIDNDQADDKIIAVLEGDFIYGQIRDISQCPPNLLDRLKHYFLTYKLAPNASSASPAGKRAVEVVIDKTYGREEAHEVISLACKDYLDFMAPR